MSTHFGVRGFLTSWLKSFRYICWYCSKYLPAALWDTCFLNPRSISRKNQETDVTSSFPLWNKMLMQTHSIYFYTVFNSFFLLIALPYVMSEGFSSSGSNFKHWLFKWKLQQASLCQTIISPSRTVWFTC